MRLETRPRFFFYSHDGLGLGHTRRNLTIARAVRDLLPEASILVASSAEGLELFSIPDGVDVLRLPGLRKVTNDRYVSRRLPEDAPEVLFLRSRLLAAAVDTFRPCVLLADKHPGGVQGELLGALDALRAHGGRAVLGLRDVLDDPVETARQWRTSGLTQLVEDRFDRVLVYGSRDVLDPLSGGLISKRAHSRIRYCGYVVTEPDNSQQTTIEVPVDDRQPVVLATAGGGEDGNALLATFVDACRGASWKGVVVGGPQMCEAEWSRLQAQALEARVTAHRAVPDLHSWFRQVEALVCMGGYNTLLEAISAGTPTVCVPRVRPRREQLIRAEGFASRGLLRLVEPGELSSTRLAMAIGDALATPRRTGASLHMGGGRRAAGAMVDLVQPMLVETAAAVGMGVR